MSESRATSRTPHLRSAPCTLYEVNMGKKVEEIPVKIEMEGFLVKGGGEEGNKKKKQRYFTMGDGMIAYFDCKKKEQADLKHVKGWFPLDSDSAVVDVGKVDGEEEKLPWGDGYAFEITSVGKSCTAAF